MIAEVIQNVAYTEVPPQVLWVNALGTFGAIVVAAMGLASSMINSRKIQEVHLLVNNQIEEYKKLVREQLILEKAKSREEGRLSK